MSKDLFQKVSGELWAITKYSNHMRSNNILHLKDLIKQHGAEFNKIMEQLLQENEINVIILYAFMKSENKIAKDFDVTWKDKIKTLICFTLRNSYLSIGNGNVFSFNGKETGDFSTLSEKDPANMYILVNKSETGSIRWPFDEKWYRLVIACSFAMNVIIEARNTVVLFTNAMQDYQIYQLNLLENCKYFTLMEKSPFEILYSCNIPFQTVIKIAFVLKRYYGFPQGLLEFLSGHKEECYKVIEESEPDNYFIAYLCFLYEKDHDFDTGYLAIALTKKSKPVITCVEKLIQPFESTARPAVEALLAVKNKTAADAASRIIRIWDNEKLAQEFELANNTGDFIRVVTKIYNKTNEKNVPYRDMIDYGTVHIKDCTQFIPDVVMKFYISEYIALKELYIIKACSEIKNRVDIYDFRNLLKQIYEMWLSEGFPIKYKNIVLAYALLAETAGLETIRKQIDEWAGNSKPGLATFAVQCIALNGSKIALLMVETMSKKHKNKRVRNAAIDALNLAMEQFGLSKNDFDDLLVPDLSFDKNRKRIFSYGERHFIATMETDLTITLSDGQKVMKSLPKTNAKFNDKEEMASAAKEELKSIKKQCKIILDAQKLRMTKAIYSGRKWSREKWETLFLENPIMFIFATGMVWVEFDSEDNLLGTFRYMEDGTLNTADEEEYELHESSYLALLHPADVDDELNETWKTQLEDYEVKQPVEQFDLPVVALAEQEAVQTELIEFTDKKTYGATVKSTANKLDATLYFGEYGECEGFISEIVADQICMQVKVEGFYAGDYSAIVKIHGIYFTEVKSNNKLMLSQIPGKVLSFAKKAGEMLTAKQVYEEAE